MLTVKQVAERLSISLSLAHRLIQSGEIPSYRIASCRRVTEDQLRSYLDRNLSEKQTELPKSKGRHF